jgi:hypothetical protein
MAIGNSLITHLERIARPSIPNIARLQEVALTFQGGTGAPDKSNAEITLRCCLRIGRPNDTDKTSLLSLLAELAPPAEGQHQAFWLASQAYMQPDTISRLSCSSGAASHAHSEPGT